MAEPVSSIITIATVSIAIIKETVSYIEKVRTIDKHIQKLLLELKDLHRLIRLVDTTYRQPCSGEDSTQAPYVRRYLTKCKDRLEDVKSLAFELGSRDADTVIQKVTLKRKSDGVKKDIDSATNDIHRYMGFINTAMHLEVVSAHRRMSETLAAQRSTPTHMILEQPADQDTRPLERFPSDTVTLFGHEPAASMRRPSTATTHTTFSRPSVSSASSRALHTQSDDEESITSSQSHISSNPNSDWVDFHFQITKCPSQEIKTILQQHLEPLMLAQSTDGLRRTPLHLAAQRNDVHLAEVLLEFGADINAQDSEPATVLDFAISFNNKEFVAFLLERGVNEKSIMQRNTSKFKEMKRIIDFRKTVSETPKKQSRKSSWSRSNGVKT